MRGRDSEFASTGHVRALAFYLPQFHPTEENDAWWGRGFTEWANVAKAQPLFRGHYQPHLPADLGFYDLRLSETREAQAEMASAHGVSGFCYYHYWFQGRRVLHRPLEEVLASGRPDFPFCLCWANESWTRRWDGRSGEVLLDQTYSRQDDEEHIRYLLRCFTDCRYVTIDRRPLFLVYRAERLPEPRRIADLWRERAHEAGLPGLFLAAVEGHAGNLDPKELGFDATVEFAPDWRILASAPRLPLEPRPVRWMRRLAGRSPGSALQIHRYADLARLMAAKPPRRHTHFRCVTPAWDNTARRGSNGLVFVGSTPERYGAWLSDVVAETRREYHAEERLLFINAWNEWAEGAHLEPDQYWGLRYLAETRRCLMGP